MKISVITLSFNSGSSIERAFNSVKRCKNKDIEYIVVDGKSTDNTIELIHKYADIIDNYVSEKDNGIYDALNKGIRMAKGEWVILLAADDELLPNAVNDFYKSVKDDTDVWCGSIIAENEYGYFYEKSEKNLDGLHVYCSLRNPASFFRREMFNKFGYYDDKYKCNGDRELFLRWYINGAKFQIEDVPIEIFHWGGISTYDLTKFAIPESKEISIKYGMSKKAADEHYGSDFRNKKIINALKQSYFWKTIYRILYSDAMFPMTKRIFHIKVEKLSKVELKRYGI